MQPFVLLHLQNERINCRRSLRNSEKLADLIEVPTDKLTDRDKKIIELAMHKEEAKEKLRIKIVKSLKIKIDDKELDERQRSRVTEEEINQLSAKDLEILAIKSKMDGGYAMTPQVLKKNATDEEYAIISENLAQLPGVDTSVDWERKYAYDGDLFRSVLGGVTTSDEGLPRERLDYYLVRDYNRNDRVGKSYLEQQYEDSLHGTKAEVRNVTDKTVIF